MKYLLTLVCTLTLNTLAYATDYTYTPDENHTPPDVKEEQQERQEEKVMIKEKKMDVRNPTTDPRFEEFKGPSDREYTYPRD